MEEIIAEELEIERKLKILEERSLTTYNLRDIEKPEDLRVIAEHDRERAMKRNASLLQELDFQCAKLHTKRLCPLQKKLNELIDKTLIESNKQEALKKPTDGKTKSKSKNRQRQE